MEGREKKRPNDMKEYEREITRKLPIVWDDVGCV